MKCPKCGYNSFEFHDTCKKCSQDLTGYKNTFGLKGIVIPQTARSAMAAHVAEILRNDQHEVEPDDSTEMFSFDLAEDGIESGVVADPQDDPFNFGEKDHLESSFGEFSFDDEPEKIATDAAPSHDAFADLLESTPQDPFAQEDSTPTAPDRQTGSQGDFDLDSFSWDEPEPSGTAKPEENFDNLFGNKNDKK